MYMAKWGDRWGSNPQPLEPQSRALPIELRSPWRPRNHGTSRRTAKVYHSGWPEMVFIRRSSCGMMLAMYHIQGGVVLRRSIFLALVFAVLTVVTSSASTSASKVKVPQGWPKIVMIPKIGVHAQVESLAMNSAKDDHAPFRWGDVAWYNLGARPGDPGRALIYGHLDSTCCPAVFYQLKTLNRGDIVQVGYKNGNPLSFRVQWKGVYWNNRVPWKFVYATTKQRGVVLVTCAGVFHRDGTGYDHKLVVYATLVTGR
jgi:hypothetical protein